jgi:hypothetical protein
VSERYHINPETGRANKCSAAPGNCRFGSDSAHESTKEAARARYEQTMATEQMPKPLAKSKEPRPFAAATSQPSDTVELSVKELTLLKRRLRGQLMAKEYKAMEIDFTTEVDVVYNRNATVAFDYTAECNWQTFTKGACGFLAYELHKRTGFPLAVLTDDPDAKGWSGHVAVRIGDDAYLDISGVSSLDSLVASHRLNRKKHTVEHITDEAIYKDRMKVKATDDIYKNLGELELAVLDRIAGDIVRDFIKTD